MASLNKIIPPCPIQVSLKSVDQRAPVVSMDDEEDIGNALRKALDLMYQAKHALSDDSGSDSDNDDGDW